MLLVLCCDSNDYTLEKIESINPEQKVIWKQSGHAAGSALPSAAVLLTMRRENRAVIAFVLFNILEYINMTEIIRYLNHKQYILPEF